MYIKICGLTKPAQARQIADLGIDALGFICVPQSKRYITPERLAQITSELPSTVEKIGVFVNATAGVIRSIVQHCHLSGVQLHGQESLCFCYELRELLPHTRLIKAFAIRSVADLDQVWAYQAAVDVLLLDAYDPHLAGGTGKQIDWSILTDFSPTIPWWLAGGLRSDNVLTALSYTKPHGIDVSSGVEISPGDKNLAQVKKLYALLKQNATLSSL